MRNLNLHVILALRDVCVLKSSDLAGHTQSRGFPFAASLSNYIGYNIAYSLSSCCFGSQDCVICATLQRCQLVNIQQPRESRAPCLLKSLSSKFS